MKIYDWDGEEEIEGSEWAECWACREFKLVVKVEYHYKAQDHGEFEEAEIFRIIICKDCYTYHRKWIVLKKNLNEMILKEYGISSQEI
jgi:hypothetical protein